MGDRTVSLPSSRIIGSAGPSGRRAGDLYPTPKEVTFALLELVSPVLPSESVIWEPACGDGDMVEALREKGHIVIATDILDGIDFLTAETPRMANWIITNPPFSLAEEFIRRAYKTGLPFAMLLKSQFWHAARRLPLFHDCPPDIVAPLTWRPNFNFKNAKKGESPVMDVLWCVWFPDRYHARAPIYIPLRKPD